jgi:hypothetical protein
MSFRPQPMVQWLSPPQLLRSASEVILSGLFGKFADKRETQSWPQHVFQHQDVDELWWRRARRDRAPPHHGRRRRGLRLGDPHAAAAHRPAARAVAALIGYADFSSLVAKLLVGTLHAALHIALVVAVLWLLLAVIPDDAADVVRWVVGLVALAIAGAVLGSLLFGAYLLTVHRLRGPKAHERGVRPPGTHRPQVLPAPPGHRGGDLELYAIGLDESCEDWEVVDGPDGTDTIVPADGKAPAPRLIDSEGSLTGRERFGHRAPGPPADRRVARAPRRAALPAERRPVRLAGGRAGLLIRSRGGLPDSG